MELVAILISHEFRLFSKEYVPVSLIHCNNTDSKQCHQAEEFSSRIQKLASQGSAAADREFMGPRFWKS